MTTVRVDQNESIDQALKRFKKELQKAGIQQELRKREYYESPSVVRKRKTEAARRKQRRKMMKLMQKIENM